jgi:hypothetical protein
MQWTRILFVAAMGAALAAGDELHLRDGTVIVGNYVGGGQKDVWFQRTPAGPEIFPLYEVESLKFNTVPSVFPSSSRGTAPDPSYHSLNTTPAHLADRHMADSWTARLKWAFALFFPPPLTAQLAHPAH